LLTGRKEHFGFRDGIAQPLAAGARGVEPSFNTLSAGEIFLGCENAFGNITHSPGTAQIDFGTHGSYMVLRTLSQDVHAFWQYCRSQSGVTGAAPDPITLASKMVGRWPSGAPLTLHPSSDPGPEFQDQDGFGYAKNDTDGSRCPFGSHVRRSNPRDSIVASTAEQSMVVANRHRLMRRGRAYGAPIVEPLDPTSIVANLDSLTDETDRGLHFISFQGSIERQFEFVQQQWCNNPKFAGLNSEADPIIGAHQAVAGVDPPVFTIPGKPVRRRATHIQRFVHVRGSGYFFMPSLSSVRYLGSLT
jgi:Dyp-type peroxidase family